MKTEKKRIPVLIAALVALLLALSGCGEVELPVPAAPELPAGEHNAQVTQGCVTNSSTVETADDFEYLTADIRNDRDAIQAENYEDIVTIMVTEHDGDMSTSWMYDANRKTVFMDFAPDITAPADFSRAFVLSDSDVETLTNTLKAADTHAWDERYSGEDIGTGSYSWSITIEYSDGVYEYHCGSGNSTGGAPGSRYEVMLLFWNYPYAENHLSEDESIAESY